MADERGEGPICVGRGRSGVVFKVPAAGTAGAHGASHLAIKVFGGDWLTKLVHYVLQGAPSPYVWCESAVRCAVLRRRILSGLVPHWFGDDLGVADAVGWAWNEEHRTHEIRTVFVEGAPASLHHPFSAEREGQLRDLVTNVLRPLQRRLVEAGFDGLVWQAGRGNPVASNNFLRSVDGAGRRRWTWIDLESGVPALFPLDPIALLAFYLPRSVKHRRPLFDDVDVPRLRSYVERTAPDLERSLGAARLDALRADVADLDAWQTRWRSMRRGHRSIEYELRKGRITPEQAAWYRRRVPLWYGRETLRLPGRALAVLGRLLGRLARLVRSIDLGRFLRAVWMAVVSQRFRMAVAHRYVSGRIDAWEERGQLRAAEAAVLRARLDSEEACTYLGDFGMHLALKPPVKAAVWWVIFPLTLSGVLDMMTGPLLMVTLGSIARTIYSAYRIVDSTARGRERPWLALLIGMLPVVGNAAYPLQFIYSGSTREAKLAQFIVYDTLTRIGEHVPIWGGRDTRTEHFCNRFGDLFAPDRTDPGQGEERAVEDAGLAVPVT